MVRSLLPPYAAWLRVYEPLAAFSEPERSYWAAYVADPGRPTRAALLAAEQEAALRRAVAVPARVGPDEELRGALPRGSEVALYDAGHAFLNDTRQEMYVDDQATLAWAKIVGFLRRNLPLPKDG